MTTTQAVLGEATVAEFAESLRGDVVVPGDASYDEARAIWNAAIDGHPAIIARCQGSADVIRAVEFARSEGLPIAVRGGGHSIPGFSTVDGGIVIDLGPMNTVRVDPATSTAVVGPGATWGDVDHETQAFGLAVTGGLISTTGVAGFTLGGGIGWLMRKHGLAADNLIAADVVTADGRLVRASADENPELLWGLRGGGGNFGIVTSFEFQLHPVGPVVLGGPIFYPGEMAGEILRYVRDFVSGIDDDLTLLVNLATAPPVPFIPEEWHGKRMIGIVAAYAGPVADGEAAVAPLRRLAEPVADLMGPIPYTALQTLLDPLWGPGPHSYMKAGYLGGLDDQAIDALIAGHAAMSSPMSEIHVQHLGGAVSRVASDATAFGDRSAPYVLNVIARTPSAEGYPESVAWGRGLHDSLSHALTGGTYVNFLSAGEGDDRVRDAYRTNYDRLVAVKTEYDPANLFRLNQNITPREG
jgi:FAD/FMN-containing dehydrogenase